MLKTRRNIFRDSRNYVARTKATVEIKDDSSRSILDLIAATIEPPTKIWNWEVLFWSKVARGEADKCWPWLGVKHSNGYGSFSFAGYGYKAHRVAYELSTGQDIPENLFACHHCDNRLCCNPSHLFIGTHTDNMRDAIAKGRGTRGRKRRFSHYNVEEIRRLYATGKSSQVALAERYGTDQSHISRILNGTCWGNRRPPGSGPITPAKVSYNHAFDFDFGSG